MRTLLELLHLLQRNKNLNFEFNKFEMDFPPEAQDLEIEKAVVHRTEEI